MGKLLYAAVSYARFLVAIAWTIGFFANSAAPKTIDVRAGTVASLAQALLVDGALLGLFAVQHSVMARPWFNRAWTRIVPMRFSHRLLGNASDEPRASRVRARDHGIHSRGVRLEERDLRASLGEPYDEYRKDVRMLLPIPRRTR